MLHKYRNEDVSLGSWMIGLDVEYLDERRLCCGSPPSKDCEQHKAADQPCIASFDWACSGLCEPVERMALVADECANKQSWE
jgi:hypothetical protein